MRTFINDYVVILLCICMILGTISSTIGSLTSITRWDISGNKLIGNIYLYIYTVRFFLFMFYLYVLL